MRVAGTQLDPDVVAALVDELAEQTGESARDPASQATRLRRVA